MFAIEIEDRRGAPLKPCKGQNYDDGADKLNSKSKLETSSFFSLSLLETLQNKHDNVESFFLKHNFLEKETEFFPKTLIL